MMTVSEVSRLTGVSVRALHHYDAIGLLKPTAVTEAGYRLYGEDAVARLHTLLLFRELGFSLADIKSMMDDPGFDRKKALREQLRLLTLEKERLERIIASAGELLEKGEESMDFTAFDRQEIEQYADEAKKRWGGTEAYARYEEKSAGRTAKQQEDAAAEMMEIFARFGAVKDGSPDSAAAQELVRELQSHITAHYYDCTADILSSLGQMYTADERMRRNIDRTGGGGTAEFTARAIGIFCNK